MDSKLTIIVTTYNSENTIKKCINSLIHLLDFGIELIIVDDASEDSTIDLVSDFNHKKISIIKNNKNIGVGRTKNIGIVSVKTKYFSFMDSDDWCTKNYYINLLKYISHNEKIDAVRCNHIHVNNNIRTIKKMPISNFFEKIPTNLYIGDTNKQSMVDYPWMQNGIYKTDYILKNKIFMDELRSAEDRIFNWKLSLLGGDIYAIPEYGYFYDKSPKKNSLTQCQDESRLDFIDAYINIISYVREFNIREYINKAVRQAIALLEFISKDKYFFESNYKELFFKKGNKLIKFLYDNEKQFVFNEVSSARKNLINQLDNYND